MTYLPKELFEIDEWIGKIADELGIPGADRGRILASLRKTNKENLAYKEDRKVLMSAYGYQRWGDLMRNAKEKLGKAPEVELPDSVFEKVPRKCYEGDKKVSLFSLKKQLATQTLIPIKQVWAKIADKEKESGVEWAEEERMLFIARFEEAADLDEFEKLCDDYINDYVEKDPRDIWLSVLDYADPLERSLLLPPVLVEELLVYSEEAGVEVSKATAEHYEKSSNPNNHWLRHLITAFLSEESRPSADLVSSTWGDADYAIRQGKLYDRETGEWDLTTTLDDVATAYKTYLNVRDEVKTHDEIAEAVCIALGREVEATAETSQL